MNISGGQNLHNPSMSTPVSVTSFAEIVEGRRYDTWTDTATTESIVQFVRVQTYMTAGTYLQLCHCLHAPDRLREHGTPQVITPVWNAQGAHWRKMHGVSAHQL